MNGFVQVKIPQPCSVFFVHGVDLPRFCANLKAMFWLGRTPVTADDQKLTLIHWYELRSTTRQLTLHWLNEIDDFQLTVLQYWRRLPHSFLAPVDFSTAMLCSPLLDSTRQALMTQVSNYSRYEGEKRQKDQWLILILHETSYCHMQPLSWSTVTLTTSPADFCILAVTYQLKPSVQSAVSSLSKLTCEQRY